MIANDWDADCLDHFIRQNSGNYLQLYEYDSNTRKRFEYANVQGFRVFNSFYLKGIERVEIEEDYFIKMKRFVIDGLNELKSIIIGKNSFYLDIKLREGSKCLIMNCDQLSEINIGYRSFYWYESFELKNLPSLISIQLDSCAFYNCHSIVFESINDWINDEWDLTQLQSITLDWWSLFGDKNTKDSNELIMKSTNDNDDWLMRSSFSKYTNRKW